MRCNAAMDPYSLLLATSPTWLAAWSAVNPVYANALEGKGLDDPLVWGGLTANDLEGDELRSELEDVLTGMKLLNDDSEADFYTGLLDASVALTRAARAPTREWANQLARVPELSLSVERALHNKRDRAEAVADDLTKLAHAGVFDLPSEWRGKRYRRAELAGDAKAQQKLEEAERTKWGRKVVDLLLEADLPFALEMKRRGLTSSSQEASRCLRGLRWTTLKKRVSDWEPVRRYLQAATGLPFPTSPAPLLELFEVRREEKAAKTTYGSVLEALRFLEEAGEVARDDLLHCHPSLLSAKKEAEAAAAKGGSGKGKRQAPQLPLAVLRALELAVLNEELPAFHRAYAWYRLFRHWASLRFDDTSGLSPESLVRRARGVSGILRQTKTSGPDKKVSVLPVFVSAFAWVHVPWLDVGLEIWLKDLGFKRDYFLPLPTLDLQGTCQKRARYSDAVGFSKSLFATLKAPDGSRLLCTEALSFWTEHSDRAGADSWLAALSVPADLRRFLGRWAVQGSEDAYVRTAIRVVENLQRLAATHARASLAGGADHLGEEHLLEQLRLHLDQAGVLDANRHVLRLKVADYDLLPDPLARISDLGVVETFDLPSAPSALSVEAVVTVADENEVLAVELDAPLDPQADEEAALAAWDAHEEEQNEEKMRQELEKARAAPEDAPVPPGYVVSITKGGRFRRLHYLGGCHRRPGQHFKEWTAYGLELPPLAQVDARCSDCFPGDKAKLQKKSEAPVEGSDSDSASSSSSSSSEEAEPSGA